MVNSLESFDEYLFSERNVAERDRALLEETICHLSVDEFIDEVADAFFSIFVKRARSRFNRICHHQDSLFAGKWIRAWILELRLVNHLCRVGITVINIEILGDARSVMSSDEILYDTWQTNLLCHLQTF